MALRIVALGALVVAGCGGGSLTPAAGDSSPGEPATIPDEPSATAEATAPTSSTAPTVRLPDDGRSELAAVLAELGVDVAGAPDAALGHADQIVCGGEELGHDGTTGHGRDDTARRCFLDAHLATVRAAFVSSAPTEEGDPIVTVWLSGPAGVDVWYDSTRDAFGSGEWSPVQGCARLTTISPSTEQPLEAPTAFWCVDGRDGAAARAPQDVDAVPEWFAQRSPLPLCGIAMRIEDADEAERQCFIDARDVGAPAEFAYLSTENEGERHARWFRSLGDGTFEAMEAQASADGTERVWYRYACSSITYYEDVSSVAWRLPTLESTCSPVESSPTDAPPAPPQATLVDPWEPCLGPPLVELTSGTGRVAMDLIYYGESSSTCFGLNVDGDAMFEDNFRPATALVVPAGELVIDPDRPGEAWVDVRPLEPGMRLAGIEVSRVVLSAASDGTYPVSLPGPGCFVVTVGWGDDVGDGTFTGLAESEPGTCGLG
ncbi:MAG: hypothetical protein M3487_01000 [Actinomycetota bacterium]|nr:hypothetical protein [Actinomycetota bacterium]